MRNYSSPATPFLASYRENPSSLHSRREAESLFLCLLHPIIFLFCGLWGCRYAKSYSPTFIQITTDVCSYYWVHTVFSSFRELKYLRNLSLGFQAWCFHTQQPVQKMDTVTIPVTRKALATRSLTGCEMSNFAKTNYGNVIPQYIIRTLFDLICTINQCARNTTASPQVCKTTTVSPKVCKTEQAP